jgi:hypothetical protein
VPTLPLFMPVRKVAGMLWRMLGSSSTMSTVSVVTERIDAGYFFGVALTWVTM